MIISKNSWYHKVYRFWLLDKHRELSDNYVSEETRQEMSDEALQGSTGSILNLCLFVKVILLYAPARYLVNVSRIKYLSKPFKWVAKSKVIGVIAKGVEKLSIKLYDLKHFRLYKWICFNIFVYLIILGEIVDPIFREIMFTISCSIIVFVLLFTIVFLLLIAGDGIRKLFNNKYVNTGGFYKEVVKPYAKAKKSNICPIINFEETDK